MKPQAFVVSQEKKERINSTAILPAAAKAPLHLDFRFLLGDLDNAQELSKVVQDMLRSIANQDSLSFSDLFLFLAVSGAGKTKAGFDILRQRWGLFFDMSGVTQGHVDVTDMLTYIDRQNRSDPQFESECEVAVLFMILTRVIFLLLLRAGGYIRTPEEWLLWQLNGLESYLVEIRTYLWDVVVGKGHQEMKNLLRKFILSFNSINNQHLICFVDETNVLLSKYPNTFSRSSQKSENNSPKLQEKYMEEDEIEEDEIEEEDEEISCKGHLNAPPKITSGIKRKKTYTEITHKAQKKFENVSEFAGKRPLFSLVLDILVNLPIAVISSGTAIRLADKAFYQSLVAKSGIEAGMKLKIIKDFHFLRENEVKKLFKRFLNLDYLQNQGIDLTSLFKKLEGRIRFSIHIIRRIIESDVPITQESINCWLNELVSSSESYSLAQAIVSFKKEYHNDVAEKILSKLIIHYIAYGGILTFSGDEDLLQSGLAYLLPCKKNIFLFSEPLVFEAVKKAIGNRYINYLALQIKDVSRSSGSIGDLLDLHVSISLVLQHGKSVYEFLDRFTSPSNRWQLNFISESLKSVQLPFSLIVGTGHRENLKGYGTDITLKQYVLKSDGSQFYLPRLLEGADGCWKPSSSVLVLTAHKSSGDGNVGSKEVDANVKATDCERIDIANEVMQSGIQLIIRIHVVLPKGANRNNKKEDPSHPPGLQIVTKKILKNYQFTEVILNIDCENLERLFPQSLANAWKERSKLQ